MSETPDQLRFTIYARKSGPGDRSPADQEKVGRRDIESIGGVVAAVFKDNLSASRYRRVEKRPGFVETKDFIRDGHADALWTFANNRAHRTLDDYVELRRLCVETESFWRYGGRTYDLRRSADRQATAADALRSEGQSDDISEAVNRGMETQLEEGRVHGKLLRGYRIIRDETSGRPIRREPIPKLAKLIQDAAERVLAGDSLGSVTADFVSAWKQADGPGFINQTVLRSMLLRPTYAGLRTHNGEVVRPASNITPILTGETHERLKALLNDPSRRSSTRGTAPLYLLSYIAVCGVCGTRVAAKHPRQRGHELPSTYRCPRGHVSRSIAAVDKYVQALLIRLLEQPSTARKLAARDEKDQGSIDEDLALIDQWRADIEVFVQDASKARLSAQHVATYVSGVENQIEEARARVDAATATVDPLLRDLAGPGAGKRWSRRLLPEKREAIRRCLAVKIMPVGAGGRRDIGVKVRPVRMLA